MKSPLVNTGIWDRHKNHRKNCLFKRAFKPIEGVVYCLSKARSDALAILVSNKAEWNNCFIKFGTLLYLGIIALFCISLKLLKRFYLKTKSHNLHSVCNIV